MSDGTTPPAYPAPGAPPPPEPPAYAPPSYPTASPAPGPGRPPSPSGGAAPLHQVRPLYKPGTIPLRPLALSDLFNGAMETIRRNPRGTIGIAAVVLTGFFALPIVATGAWGWLAGFGSELSTTTAFEDMSPQDVGLAITVLVGLLLGFLATIVLTGMIVHVVEHAARGRRLDAAEAWTLTRPRIRRLFGLSALSFVVPLLAWVPAIAVIVVGGAVTGPVGVLIAILGVALGFGGMFLLYIRLFQIAPACLVLEDRGVFAAMRRAWELTSGSFWRLFGITALTVIVTAIAAQFLAFPVALLGEIGASIWPDTLAGMFSLMLARNLAQIVSGSLTTPFSAGVAALQYLDLRIRKEGYDIELLGGVPADASWSWAGYAAPAAPAPPFPPPPPFRVDG